MFGSLIEELRIELDEEAKKLMPFKLSAERIRQANETLRKLRRDSGYDEKPDVKTSRKVLIRGFGSKTD